MALSFAGLYTDTITYPSGAAAASIPVTVYVTGTQTLAALYTDRTKAVAGPNPVTSSALGNLSFYANPAEYDVWVAGAYAFTVLVGVDPADSGSGSNPNSASVGADLTGTTNTLVTSTSLTAPLPVAQGGTGSASQNFVDLSADQTVAGIKTFTSVVRGVPPVGSSDYATKGYADANVTVQSWKNPAKLCTTAALSPANTYSGGVLTATGNGTLTVDSVLVALNDRVIVKDEAAPANNGLYACTTAGTVSVPYVLTRATDMDAGSEVVGAIALVTAGTVNGGFQFNVSGAGPFTLGTTAINWFKSGTSTAYTAGTGLTLTGSTFSVTPSTYDASGAAAAATASAMQKSANGSDIGTLATFKTNIGVGGVSGIASLDSGTRLTAAQVPVSNVMFVQLPERSVSDAVISGTTTLTSATAAFTSGDTGKTVVGLNVPAGTTLTYSSATVCTLSQACTNGTSLVVTIVSGAYALRNTVTSDATRYVIWRGALSPTVGSGYMIAGTDSYESTA